MFRVIFLVYVLFVSGNKELREESLCKKFSLPKDHLQFYEHLDEFLKLRQENHHEKGSASLCHMTEDPLLRDLEEMGEIIEVVLIDLKEAEDKRKEKKSSEEEMNAKRKELPKDCSDILANQELKSGVYRIYPYYRPINVFCDLETKGGGWTVLLSRTNHSKQLNFTRDWSQYKTGFGSPDSEYWLGNENLHRLTCCRKYVMRLEARNHHGGEIWGEWNSFEVDSENNKYQLKVEDYNEGSLARKDHFSYHNGMKFSTFDQDHDAIGQNFNCASDRKGGWWYNDCDTINPTGIYVATGSSGLAFDHWSNIDTTARKADWLQLKIRPAY